MRGVLAGCAFAALAAAAGPAFPQTSIGFVSLDRILREAPAAQLAQKKLEQEFSQRGQELQKLGEQIKKIQEGIERNAMTMLDSERQKREREFADANREFQRKQREFNEDLAQRRKDEFERVIERANRAVRQIAEAEKYDIIFQEAVFASARIDITDKVIRALDDSAPAKK